MNGYVAAIDQGTTSTRFMVFDHAGNEVGSHQLEHQQILPRAGWVEHDPVEIWERTRTVVKRTLADLSVHAADLAAVGVTNQRETTVVWDRRTGRPLYNAIVWQDTRTDRIAAALDRDGRGDVIREKAGLPPAIRPSSDPNLYGTTRPAGPFGGEVALAGDLGDQQAAMVGQVCFSPGEAKNTYGTGNFLLLNTGTTPVRSKAGLLTTVCYQLGDAPAVYAPEGSIAVTGSAVQWLRDQLHLIDSAEESESLARQVPDNGGVYFVPAFSGLFAPYWRSDARGVIVGLSRFNTDAHIARAALEAICYQSKDVALAMEADSGVRLDVLRVDGGVTVNDLCMQLQADILGVPVSKPVVAETTALGAAYAAGGRRGVLAGRGGVAAELERGQAVAAAMDRRAARPRLRRLEEGRATHAQLGRRRLTSEQNNGGCDGTGPGATSRRAGQDGVRDSRRPRHRRRRHRCRNRFCPRPCATGMRSASHAAFNGRLTTEDIPTEDLTPKI